MVEIPARLAVSSDLTATCYYSTVDREKSPSEGWSDSWEPPENPILLQERQERARARRRLPGRRDAHKAVERALRTGLLTRMPCESCGRDPAEAHHDSYEPADHLKVRWLCKRCHDKDSKRRQHGEKPATSSRD